MMTSYNCGYRVCTTLVLLGLMSTAFSKQPSDVDGISRAQFGHFLSSLIQNPCGNRFTCSTSPLQCIPGNRLCDGHSDCDNGSDEATCHCRGTTRRVQCISGTCIHESQKCDRISDCQFGEDELFCGITGCPGDKFLCANFGNCIVGDLVCNGINDCQDGQDEDPYYCRALAEHNSHHYGSEIGNRASERNMARNSLTQRAREKDRNIPARANYHADRYYDYLRDILTGDN